MEMVQQHVEIEEEEEEEAWRFPLGRSVDAVRWLPNLTPVMDKLLVVALWDASKARSHVELASLCHREEEEVVVQSQAGRCDHWLETQVSWPQPARTSALSAVALSDERVLVATASVVGSLSLALVEPFHPSQSSAPLICPSLHRGSMSALDFYSASQSCVSVGDDGKINIVSFGESGLQPKCFYDSHGLMSFSAVRWSSPVEFVTGGIGSSLQWWDTRQPGGAVLKATTRRCERSFTLSTNLIEAGQRVPGMIHSIDVHPSRKHICVVGGSVGSVLSWDLRWQQEPVLLTASNTDRIGNVLAAPLIESEVWEVKYDNCKSLSGLSKDTVKASPVMVCSEDGILALLGDGAPTELHAEPCAINSFDIDPDHGRDIICALEHETLIVLRRGLKPLQNQLVAFTG